MAINEFNIEEIVKNELCTGCGTCAGICPSDAIVIEKSKKKGLYFPVIDNGKCSYCNRCLNACPGKDVDFESIEKKIFNNESNQKMDFLIGPYIDCFISQCLDPNILENSASGGLITSLLIFALEHKIIDGALVTRMNPESPLESQSFIARTSEEIIASSKSKYCPVATNVCLKEIIDIPGKYAVVGLPCQIHGIRKAEILNPKLRQRIVLHFGIFCSHTVDFCGTEVLLSKFNISTNDIMQISYRAKGWPGGILLKLNDKTEKFIPHGQYWAPIFGRFFFTPIRCTLCCDGLAEMADISFGDAWLPEFKREKCGMSILINRTQFGSNLLNSALKSNIIKINSISPMKVFQSQRDQILFKGKNIVVRNRIYKFFGHEVPRYGDRNYIQPNIWDYVTSFIPYLNIIFSRSSFGRHILTKCPLIVLNVTGIFIQKIYDKSYGEFNFMRFEPIAKVPPKIHIVNSYSPNFGDLAIISTTISTLKGALHGCEISVATTNPDLTAKYIDTFVVSSLSSRSSSYLVQALNFALFIKNSCWLYFASKGINLFFLANKKTRQALYEYIDADLIVSCGGGYLNDNAGPAFLGCLLDIYLANTLGKPVIHYAQSIGPFNNKYLKIISSYILNRSDKIILRDEISKMFIDDLNLKKPKVIITADIAMLLPTIDGEISRKLLDNEGIDMSAPLITITVKPWSFPEATNPTTKKQAYMESLIKLSEYIVENYGANVVFIPMDVHEKKEGITSLIGRSFISQYNKINEETNFIYTGELDLIHHVIETVNKTTKVIMLKGNYNPAEIKSIISYSWIHIATRMHSSIFAAANLVPIIGIAYEPKMSSFLNTLGQSSFLIDIDTVDAKKLKNMFDDLWNNRDTNKKILSINGDELKRKALLNNEILIDMIYNH